MEFLMEYCKKEFKDNGYECFLLNSYPEIWHNNLGYVKTSAHFKPCGTAFSKQSLKQMSNEIKNGKNMFIKINEKNDIEFGF